MRSLVVLLFPSLALAQFIANPARLPDRWKSFERSAGEARLQCRVTPVQPRLNLGFRFQTGYNIEIPMKQYTGAGHWWSVVLRVTPELKEREPVWLVSRLQIPRVPNTKVSAEFGGAYVVGEGKYRVDMLLVDDSSRTCSTHWNIRARLSDQIREVRAGMPSGAVDDISLRRWRAHGTTRDEPRFNVSILLHASPAFPGRVRLQDYDRMLLMSALVSMVEHLPVNVRLTVFSMDRQKELYHSDDLSAESFRQAADVVNKLELGTVDYATLQNAGGHVELISSLLKREVTAERKTDAVIVLGPLTRWADRAPEAMSSEQGNVPVYYVQLRPWRAMAAFGMDTISHAVRRLGGRTKQVYSPDDFAEAIQDIDRVLNQH